MRSRSSSSSVSCSESSDSPRTTRCEVATKKGCLIRREASLESEEVCVLEKGTAVCALGDLSSSTRIELVEPVCGWASTKCLRETMSAVMQGRARWAVDIGTLPAEARPGTELWKFLLEKLIQEKEERETVTRYVRDEDQVRALISRLLARRVCGLALRVGHDSVQISRTKGKKPFVTEDTKAISPVCKTAFPNFNFNVSHEGRYVVLASEPCCVCGVDVAAPDQFRRGRSGDVEKFFHSMRDVLSAQEWHFVRLAASQDDQARRFRYFWSCKEAFTKARGDGLAFGLKRAEFTITMLREVAPVAFEATVAVDGKTLPQWRFFGDELPNGHIVTVARGPPADVQDAIGNFKRTLSRDHLQHHDLEAPHPQFDVLNLKDLVPDEYYKAMPSF